MHTMEKLGHCLDFLFALRMQFDSNIGKHLYIKEFQMFLVLIQRDRDSKTDAHTSVVIRSACFS